MNIVQRFFSFDQLIGPVLVKIIYYFATAAIVLFVGITMVSGLLAIFTGAIGTGVMQLVAAPAVGAVALLYWRFLCELFLVAFKSYERLGEIRDLAAGHAHQPDYPEF